MFTSVHLNINGYVFEFGTCSVSTHKVNDAFLSAVDDELLLLLEHADKLKAANTAALLKAAFLKKLIFSS